MPATIGPGSTGDDVRRLQRALARQLLWQPFGPITGAFDAELETSVKSFQAANGLPVDGLVGPATWAKLPAYREASPTLRDRTVGAGRRLAPAGAGRQGRRRQLRPLPRPDRRPVRPADRSGCRALQTWAAVPVTGVVDDATWFVWMTPGSAQQLTLENACGLLNKL